MYRSRFSPLRLTACLLSGAAASLLLALAGPTLSTGSWSSLEHGDALSPDFALDLFRSRTWLTTQYVACMTAYEADPLAECRRTVHAARYAPAWEPQPVCSQHILMSSYHLVESGWPMRSFSMATLDRRPSGLPPVTTGPGADIISGRLEILVGSSTLSVPLNPSAPAIIVNTLTWSAAAWLGAQLILQLRAFSRTRQGRCPACSYDLRATPPASPCSECGYSRPD